MSVKGLPNANEKLHRQIKGNADYDIDWTSRRLNPPQISWRWRYQQWCRYIACDADREVPCGAIPRQPAGLPWAKLDNIREPRLYQRFSGSMQARLELPVRVIVEHVPAIRISVHPLRISRFEGLLTSDRVDAQRKLIHIRLRAELGSRPAITANAITCIHAFVAAPPTLPGLDRGCQEQKFNCNRAPALTHASGSKHRMAQASPAARCEQSPNGSDYNTVRRHLFGKAQRFLTIEAKGDVSTLDDERAKNNIKRVRSR
eukprot:scaffold12548_cov128-Isochrysis_galbana.AAC.2